MSTTSKDAKPSTTIDSEMESLFSASINPDKAIKIFAGFSEAGRKSFLEEAVRRHSVAVLEGLAGSVSAKKDRKEIKKALHKLSSKGIAVSKDAGKNKRRGFKLIAEDIPTGAFSSLIDGAGRRLIWFLDSTSGSNTRIYLAQLLISDVEGIMGAERDESTRSRARKLLKAIAKQDGMRMVECPPEYLAGKIKEADALSRSKGITMPPTYLAMRGWLPKADEKIFLPAVEVKEADRDNLVRQSAKMLDEPEFDSWQPDRRTIAYCHERLSEVETSTLYISEQQKVVQRSNVIDDTARKMAEGTSGTLYKNRLADMAEMLLAMNRKELARLAAATAVILPTNDAVPFFVSMVQRTIGKQETLVEEAMSEEAAPESPLIITG